jgi:hypothetical protein
MPHPLATIQKNDSVYIALTPDENFLIGHREGKPAAFLFSQKKKATAYLAAIGKPDHKAVKEAPKELVEELVEVGVYEAFLDAELPHALPDPLFLPKFLEHLAKPVA